MSNYKMNELAEPTESRESPKIEIQRNGFDGETGELEEALEKYDVPQMVSQITGLSWKNESLKIKHIDKSADWEGNDTILVNLGRGAYALSGVAHECLHLILRQNNWLESPKISDFVEKYPEMRKYPIKRKGYPLEQMIAYLVQDEISKKIGKQEGLDRLVETGGHGKFGYILETEYSSKNEEKLGKIILKKWQEKDNYENIIKGIESIISEFEKDK